MSLWSKLFGGGGGGSGASAAPPEIHKEFSIYPEPAKEGGGYRVVARIEKEIDGEVKRHDMIRADVCSSLEEAIQTSLHKAKSLIDQQGVAIFD